MSRAKRRVVLAGLVGFVFVVSCSISSVYGEVASAPKVVEDSTLITSIETSGELGQWSSNDGTLSLSTENVTEGTYCMKVEFGAGDVPDIMRYASFDVSGYDRIKFDVTLEGQPVLVNIKFWDSTSKSFIVWEYLIQEGFQRVECSIAGIDSALDPSSLVQMHIWTDTAYGAGESGAFYIDNLVAMRGEHDDEWLMDVWGGEPLIEVPGNILANGDFEAGLQNWDSWGTWEDGLYYFDAVSEEGEVKSGAAAARIICITEGRGGIYQQISLDPGQYELSYWIKADGSNGTARFYFSNSNINPSSPSEFVVPTIWTEMTQTLTVSSTSSAYFYLFSTGSANILFDAVSIADPNATTPSPTPSMTPSVVTIEGVNTYVDGEPFFPIGIFGGNVGEIVANTGFNFIPGLEQVTLEELDELEANGLMTWLDLTGLARAHLPMTAGNVIDGFKDHPAILLWYLCDEPDHAVWNVPPPEIRVMDKSIKEVDTGHPTGLITMSWAESNFYQYATTCDILMTDIYDRSSDDAVVTVIEHVDECRAAIGPDEPMWIVLYAVWDSEPERSPGYYVACAYGSVVHSANGIMWFAYSATMSYPNVKNAIWNVTLELEALSPALTAPTSAKEVASSSANVHALLKEYDGNYYLIVINIGSAANGVTLTIPDISATSADVWFEDRTENIAGGVITDDFSKHERHVYVFEGTAISTPSSTPSLIADELWILY